MRQTINLAVGATGTGYSTAASFLGYSSGALLKVGFVVPYNNGTITSIILQESTDGTTYTTLKDCGTLTGDNPFMLYSFSPYLRLSYGFTQGTSTADKGLRLSCNLWAFRPGCWKDAFPCRDEHLRGVYSMLINTVKGFPGAWDEQAQIAKADLETAIRGRGIDPDSLFLDAHETAPCVEGLEIAGAWRVAYYALLNAQGPRREDWAKDLELCNDQYTLQLAAFFDSGRGTQDASGDAAPDEGEKFVKPVRVTR